MGSHARDSALIQSTPGINFNFLPDGEPFVITATFVISSVFLLFCGVFFFFFVICCKWGSACRDVMASLAAIGLAVLLSQRVIALKSLSDECSEGF